MKKEKEKGEINMIQLGEKVIVTDPCYGLIVPCKAIVNNVVPGEYETSVETIDCGNWGERISSLSAIKRDSYREIVQENCLENVIGVDSGQVGIFDYDYRIKQGDDLGEYHDESSIYKRICNLTGSSTQWGELDNKVVASSSGFGDGCYDLVLFKNKEGKIIGFKVIFIYEE